MRQQNSFSLQTNTSLFPKIKAVLNTSFETKSRKATVCAKCELTLRVSVVSASGSERENERRQSSSSHWLKERKRTTSERQKTRKTEELGLRSQQPEDRHCQINNAHFHFRLIVTAFRCVLQCRMRRPCCGRKRRTTPWCGSSASQVH